MVSSSLDPPHTDRALMAATHQGEEGGDQIGSFGQYRERIRYRQRPPLHPDQGEHGGGSQGGSEIDRRRGLGADHDVCACHTGVSYTALTPDARRERDLFDGTHVDAVPFVAAYRVTGQAEGRVIRGVE